LRHDDHRLAGVNFIAHVQVALIAAGSRRDDAELAFGAALPDLVSMAGLRIDRALLPEAVREGVALHHRTDTTFHSLVEFTTGVRQLREQLKAGGLAVGPSRAVGHAGWELLLDGCLLDRAGVEEGFARMLRRAPDIAEAVAPADPDRWRGLVSDLETDKWWLGYRDPAVIADRLHRRLQARRRLSFGSEDLALVADVLAAAKPTVDAATDGVVAAVMSRLAQDDDREAPGGGQ
jgi:acyl carrier protein phosphodiesterase